MWQSSISTVNNDSYVLEEIGKKILPVVDRFGGIVLKDSVSDRVRLSIAVNDRFAESVRRRLEEELAVAVGQYYKEKYLTDRVNPVGLPSCYFRAFIQALVSFDRGYEREFIKSVIPETDTLSLDGLLRFRCEELKSRWDEIADLATESSCRAGREVCLELIKFLLSTQEYERETVNVCAVDGAYVVEDKYGQNTVSAEELCAHLIRLSPKKVLTEDCNPDAIEIELLTKLFF